MDSELTTIALVKGLTAGISDGNVLTANDVVVDNDFLRIDGTEVEGLTVAEVLTALNVEAGADVTDATNVTAAGALMDSELAGIAAVKATTGTFLTADQTKLDTIETSADVTDTTNVTAAGALMDSELAGLAAVKATTGTFLSADESKLDGIEASADVTDTANVKSALNASFGGSATIGDGSDTFTIPGALTVTGTTTTNNVVTVSTSNGVVFEGAAADGHDGTLISVVAGADVTYTLPNVAGYVGLFAADPGTTTISSTPAELNLLDGVSGLVQADLTKLAAVDSTAAELNIVDGGTAASSVTVADADRVVYNDAGTMKQVAVTDLAAYFDDEITTMPNLVGVGTITSGAWTSSTVIASAYLDADTAHVAVAQTLTNKTLTSPDINGGTWNGTVDGNSTAAGITWADLGSVTTIDINGGTINGITDLAIADGGTGASSASAALTALGAEASANKVTKLLSGHVSNTTYNVVHSFSTPIVNVQVLDYGNAGSGATYDVVQVEIQRNDDNSVDLIFAAAPGTSQDYLVLISKFPAIS
jgi:hypothetical protein